MTRATRFKPGGGRRIFQDGKIQGTSPPGGTLSCLTRVVNLLHVKELTEEVIPPELLCDNLSDIPMIFLIIVRVTAMFLCIEREKLCGRKKVQ
jgi:hypothetical protein